MLSKYQRIHAAYLTQVRPTTLQATDQETILIRTGVVVISIVLLIVIIIV
jgi:hypothetical protein